MIEDYNVLESRGEAHLIDQVKAWMENGWQPIGGVVVTMCDGKGYYTQAIVRYTADPTKD